MRCEWKGVFPAAVTHFRDDQSLDLPAMLRHLDIMIDSGVHGLIVLGTVGENCSLEYAEKLEVIRAVVKRIELSDEEVRLIYRVAPVPFVERPSRGALQDCPKGQDPLF